MCLVGDSARARKGSSWDHVRRLIIDADPSLEPRILTGLSSGEGVIWAVRDPTAQDPGITDQRLLVIEPEFASALKAASREISTLSPTLRSGWDGRPLAILTRTAPARASTAHIALIGHITQHELRRHTTSLELANGYINRVLLIACRRQRLLPDGGDPDPLHDTGLDRLLAAALQQARTAGQVRLDPDARELWHHAYRKLATQPHDGIVAQITARAEAHVIRLALLYTLTDGKRQINAQHLTAALALQDYAARSAAWALTGATGDPLAEQIHAVLQPAPRRADPQPDQPDPEPQPARRPDRPRPPRPPHRRPRHHRADPDRRPTRAALDRHQPPPPPRAIAATGPATATREWVASLARPPPRHDTPRVPRATHRGERSKRKRSGLNARRTPARPPTPTPFIAGL